MKKKFSSAFSLIELSIVLLIVGILIAGVTQTSRLINLSKLRNVQILTQNSPVSGIQDLAVWYETTLERSFGGEFPENEDPVATWYDTSPQGGTNHAIQTNSNYQPLFIQSCINGWPCLRFDGSNDRLITPISIDHKSVPNVTIFAVFVAKGDNNDRGVESIIVSQTDNYPQRTGRTMAVYTYQLSSSNTSFFTLSLDAFHELPSFFSLVLRDGVSNGSKATLNGNIHSMLFTDSPTDLSSISAAPTMLIGIDQGMYAYSFLGDISEIIVYNRALKNEERQAVEVYLSKKWGVPLGRGSDGRGYNLDLT